MKDETIVFLAAIAALVVIAVTTCAIHDCYELAGILSIISAIAGYAYSTYRNAESTPESTLQK
jgi:hypothetical protein